VTFALIGRALAAGPALSIVPVLETLQAPGGWAGLGIGVDVGLFEPVCNRRLHFVAMDDADGVHRLALRRRRGAPDLGRLQRTPEEEAHLEELFLRADEEVARLAREHDRVVRGVDALLAERRRRLAQPFPRLTQVIGQAARQRRFRRRPAVVRLAGFHPPLAVVALVAFHAVAARAPARASARQSRRWRASAATRGSVRMLSCAPGTIRMSSPPLASWRHPRSGGAHAVSRRVRARMRVIRPSYGCGA